MNWLRLMLAVAGNETRVLFKDRGALALFLLLPLLISGLIFAPQIVAWDDEEAPVVSFNLSLVNEDEGPYGAQIATILQQIDILKVTETGDATAANREVANREKEAAVIIPQDFSARIDGYEPTALELVVDPTQEAMIAVLTGALDSVVAEVTLVGEIQYGIRAVMAESEQLAATDPARQQAVAAQTLGVIMTQLNERRTEPAIAVVSQDMAGRTAAVIRDIIVVAMMPGMAILISFFVTTSLINSFYREKDQGSFRRLLAAPIPRSAIIAGKMIAYMLVVFLQLGSMIVLSNLVVGMPVGDSPLALFLIILSLALAVTAVGMFLTAVSRTQKQAGAWAMVAALVLGILGGCIFNMPEPLVFRSDSVLGAVSRLTPQGNAMDALIRVMAEGAGLVDVLPQVGTILAITAVLYVVALWRFRFE